MTIAEHTNIKNYLKSFSVLTTSDIGKFLQQLKRRKLKKSEFFIREGQVCKEVAFIVEGTLRSFYRSGDGTEITYCIRFPNNLTTAYSSFITGNATQENIQCLSSVELLVIKKARIDELAGRNPRWVKFLKTIAEEQYIELEKQIFQLQKGNAQQRYRELEMTQPALIQNIPLQHLASYLGVTQRHLSRIRNKN
jgi:CRP-like cAMP-binding protein